MLLESSLGHGHHHSPFLPFCLLIYTDSLNWLSQT